jgi:hypothetical protein
MILRTAARGSMPRLSFRKSIAGSSFARLLRALRPSILPRNAPFSFRTFPSFKTPIGAFRSRLKILPASIRIPAPRPPTRRDATLTTATYGRLPVLVNRSAEEEVKVWPVR